ncbi:MAG: choice-of-anchor D domain-containing protein [Pirellulales bacterium]
MRNNSRLIRKPLPKRVPTFEQCEPRRPLAADSFVGMYREGEWKLSDNPAQGISFGLPGDQPVMGDWNGDGRKTPGVYRNGLWILDLTGNGSDIGDRVLHFGLPGDKAVAGDWDGDGIDTVGVFRDGAWFFDRNGNGYDAADVDPVFFGWGSDIPVPGDWDGDGKDSPGIYRAGTWALDLTGNGFDAGDRFLQFGLPGDQPVSGDWNKDGKDTPGVLQNNRWFFDLEGDGYTGEASTPNRFGTGIAVAGKSSIGPRPTVPTVLPGGLGEGGSSRPSTPTTPPRPSTPNTPTRPSTPAPGARPEVDVAGIADGQSTPVSFGSVHVGQSATRTFTVRNLGNATLTLGQVQVPTGFTLLSGLPGSLAPNATATFRIGMNSSTAGSRTGTVSFVTNDSDESVYSFVVTGNINPPTVTPPNTVNPPSPVMSNYGTVIASQRTIGTAGSILLKTVRTYNAAGNNLRLYADFFSATGAAIRTDVLIGNPTSSFGDQSTPLVTSLDLGRYAIAWRSTGLSGRTDIHYAVMDAYGSAVSAPDSIANIGYSTQLELRAITRTSAGFQVTWRDASSNLTFLRDFNISGVATTGVVRG